MTSLGRRIALFVGLSVACAAIVLVYVGIVRKTPGPASSSISSVWVKDRPAEVPQVLARPHVVFVNTTFDDRNNRVSIAPLSALSGPRYVTAASCDRVYVGSKRTLCLKADSKTITSYAGIELDENFNEVWRFPLKAHPAALGSRPTDVLAP